MAKRLSKLRVQSGAPPPTTTGSVEKPSEVADLLGGGTGEEQQLADSLTPLVLAEEEDKVSPGWLASNLDKFYFLFWLSF